METGRIKSECKGCTIYRNQANECGSISIPCISETDQCPCRTCLVKVTCKYTCEAFDAYGKRSGETFIRQIKFNKERGR